jgi:hypothetical protein
MKVVGPVQDGDRRGKEAQPARPAGVAAGPRRLSG